MNVVQRVRDLCSANVHLALERLESPEAMLGQAIREMESDLSRSLHAAASLIALEKLLARRIAEHEAEIHSLEGRARKEVAAGREARARTAVRRKLDAERALAGLREQSELVTENRRTLRQQIDGLSEKLAEARRMRAALGRPAPCGFRLREPSRGSHRSGAVRAASRPCRACGSRGRSTAGTARKPHPGKDARRAG